MLNAMRKTTGTWVVRIFLALLIGSFAVWGIGDFVRGGTDTSVAKVGGVEISQLEFSEQLRRDLQRVQSQLGTGLTTEQAKALGLHEQTLRNLIGRTLLDTEADKLGLAVPDARLAEAIRETPAFRGPSGTFDKFTYESAVRNQGWTTTRFENLLRRDLIRDDLAASIVAGVRPVPKILVDRLHAYRSERREAEIAVIEERGEIAPPDQETLKKYHQDNAARFTAPEMRSFAYFALEPKDLTGEVNVTEEELREEYHARQASYGEPERRQVEQIVYPDQAAADAAFARISEGASFAAVAKSTRNMEAADLSLGLLTKQELPAELSEAAFALAQGGISKPLKTGFGWHILRITEIKPASEKSFEQVKDEIAADIKLQRAADILYRTGTRLQDEIAGGASIEQVAEKARATVRRVAAMDRQGRGPDGKAVADLPLYREFLRTVWDARAGGEPELQEMAEGAYVVVRVDGSTPATLKPLDTVKPEVIAAWTAEQRRARAEAAAKELAEALKAGGDFATLAVKAGSSVRTSGSFLRDGTGADRSLVAGGMAAQLFTVKPGEVLHGPAGDGESAVVARLKAISPADAADAATRERLGNTLAAGYADDLSLLYRQALEKSLGVKINRANMDKAN